MKKRNLPRLCAGIFLALLGAFAGLSDAGAQAHLAVGLEHPVYNLIETAELRGVLSRVSSVKPYTRAQTAEFLARIQGRMGEFSAAEQALIGVFASEFGARSANASASDEGARKGKADNVRAPLWTSEKGLASAGLSAEMDFKTSPGGIAELIGGAPGAPEAADLWHFNSRLTPYIAGAITPWLSARGEAGFTIDKVERSLYLPYSFTKEWDAGHISFGEPRYSSGELDYPTFSYDIRQDIAAATDSGSFMARLSRLRRDWGAGSGSFALSGTARPFVGLELIFQPSRYFALSSLVGSLTNWEKGSAEKSTAKDPATGDYTAISWQKMLGLQRLELFPFEWLTLSATSSLVGAKRFELGYFSPLLFSVMYQNQLADVDNLGVQLDASLRIPRFGKIYASFYADEMEITHLDELFTKARNMFALQAGLKASLPGLPFFTLTAQYTKIEPFVYTHYPTWYPDYRLRVDTSYTQDGENLGYYLPPNSDEFLVRLEAMPAPGWRAAAGYSFVRHGTNPGAQGDPVIFGDMDKYLPYTADGMALTKDFLHDGIYDYNHIVKTKVYWRPLTAPELFGAPLPLELSAGYGFSYTCWEDGTGAGRPVPSPEWRHSLELGAKFFL